MQVLTAFSVAEGQDRWTNWRMSRRAGHWTLMSQFTCKAALNWRVLGHWQTEGVLSAVWGRSKAETPLVRLVVDLLWTCCRVYSFCECLRCHVFQSGSCCVIRPALLLQYAVIMSPTIVIGVRCSCTNVGHCMGLTALALVSWSMDGWGEKTQRTVFDVCENETAVRSSSLWQAC